MKISGVPFGLSLTGACIASILTIAAARKLVDKRR